jgi:hypothetical protein
MVPIVNLPTNYQLRGNLSMKIKTHIKAGQRECHLVDPVKGTTICCEDVPDTWLSSKAG